MNTDKRQGRNEAHKQQTVNHFNHVIAEALGIERELAPSLIGTVLGKIVRRIDAAEAAQFVSQLPDAWKQLMLDQPAGPDRGIDAESLVGSVCVLLDYDYEESEELIRQFWKTLGTMVSAGGLEDVLSQLPKDIQQLLLADAFEEFHVSHGAVSRKEGLAGQEGAHQ